MNQASASEVSDLPRAMANRDINPHARLAASFPSLEPLIVNRAVSEAFAAHEQAAVRWKTIYTWLGRVALVAIFLVMGYFDYSFTLGRLRPPSESLRALMTLIAALGLGAQLVLIFGRIKERWLLARFAAERLRSLKFQCFAMVAISENAEQLSANVAAFTNEELARLEQELLGGRSALDEFSPSEQTIALNSRAARAGPELIRDAFRAYDSLRLEVQAQHFGEQARQSDQRARTPNFLSELTFGLGAVLAFCDICGTTWAGLVHGHAAWSTGPLALWLAFFTLLLFVTSAILAVYQRGSADVADLERYKHYAREIRRIRHQDAPASGEAFLRLVEQTEQIELRELFDFCRDASHSSYIF